MNEIKTTAIKLLKTKETYQLIFAGFALFLAYMAFVVVPERNIRIKAEADREQFLVREVKYKLCIEDAEESYNNVWNNNCKSFGDVKTDNCLLPTRIADDVNETFENDKKACLTRYTR